jgi:hypothetical protein
MTISEMHIAFDLLLDKVNSLQYPSFLAEEKDFFLNQAIRKFAKTRYSGMNAKREGFEQSQKRIDDLRTLVRELTIPCTSTGHIHDNGYVLTNTLDSATFTTMPYWLSLGEEVDILYQSSVQYTPNFVSKRVGVINATANDYRYKLDDPLAEYRLHYDEAKPLRLFYNNTIEFITDGNYSVTNAYLRFLKRPAIVTSFGTPVDCDLAEHTHDEIVALAVQMALENVEQPRLGSYSELVNTME